jgi:hypothetical protein
MRSPIYAAVEVKQKRTDALFVERLDHGEAIADVRLICVQRDPSEAFATNVMRSYEGRHRTRRRPPPLAPVFPLDSRPTRQPQKKNGPCFTDSTGRNVRSPLEVKLLMTNTRKAPSEQPRPRGGARPGAGRKPIPDYDAFVVLIGSEYERLMRQEGRTQLEKEIRRRRERGETGFLLERPLSPRRQRVLPFLQWKLRTGALEREQGITLTPAQRNVSLKTLGRKVAAYRRLVRDTRPPDLHLPPQE